MIFLTGYMVNRQQQALLASVMKTTDVMLVYLDLDFNFVWVNQAYANTCQMAPADMIGKNHFALYPNAENESIFRKVRATGQAAFYKDKPFEFLDQPERGVTYWDWSLAPDKDQNGQVAGFVFSLRETTCFVSVQQAARENELRYRSLFDNALAGIAHCRLIYEQGQPADFVYLDVNAAFSRLTGLAGVVGNKVSAVIPGIRESNPELFHIYGRVVSQGQPEKFEIYIERLNAWFLISVYPAEEHCFVTLFDNITERKVAEDRLRAAKIAADTSNNTKSRFLAAVSHDLRQPLSALALYIHALEHKLALTGDPLFAKIEYCITNLNEMLSSLLDLSRLEAGVVTPQVGDFTLDTIISGIVASHAPDANLKRLVLRYRSCSLIGRTDPVLFQRIIGNFVANAVRYTHHGGILIGCRRHLGKVWVEVWDTGIGIPADKTNEIFEEFRQLGNVERNPAKGAGLGLAIVAKTAALLGLQVRVNSRPGKGSLFAVELPLGDAPASLEVQNQLTHKHARIALVEDNVDVAEALSFTLSCLGHQVISAASRLELMPLLDGIPPDIVISDYRLSGDENGIDGIYALRANFDADLPAIIITGDTDPAIVSLMSEKQICILYKPLNLAVLKEKIAELTA